MGELLMTVLLVSILWMILDLSLIHIYKTQGKTLQDGLDLLQTLDAFEGDGLDIIFIITIFLIHIDHGIPESLTPVSYTHLDVYKRQVKRLSNSSRPIFSFSTRSAAQECKMSICSSMIFFA